MGRRTVAGRRVGALESDVLDVLWSAAGWLSGREVWERLGDPTRAYTTVMTVLGRLLDKGLVERVADGKGHRYRAAGDPDELTAQAIRSLLSSTTHPKLALARFVDSLDDPDLVAELAVALERARRSRR